MTVYGLTPSPGAFPGVSHVFIYGQQVCDQFKHIYLSDLPKVPTDAPVIWGAWHPSYSLPLRRRTGKNYVLWTSPPLQTELQENEPGYLEMLLGLRKKGLIELIHLDKDSQGILPGLTIPAPFTVPKVKPVSLADREGAAFYSPAHPRKNVLTQVLGAKAAGLTVHLNGFAGYTSLLKALEVPFVDYGWFQTKEAYLDSLAHRQVSLCCFLSESFCFSAAESLAVGTPVVASPVVADNMGLPWMFTLLDDPASMAQAIRKILDQWEQHSAAGRAAIEATAARNNEGFRKAIEMLMSKNV